MFDHKCELKFEKLWKIASPGQGKLEYWLFLSFVKAYLARRDIFQPVVLEIGVRRGYQRMFYKEFLNADYIGMDINADFTKGEDYILGDSSKVETLNILIDRLGGRDIDLLFIDGNHTYAAVKRDWELYSPLTSHLVAIHDILWSQVKMFWAELCAKKYQVIEFKCPQREHRNKDDGLGVVLL